MAAEGGSSKARPSFLPSGILILVGALGFFVLDRPLRSLRPDAPDPTSAGDSLSEELVEARLWQDPLRPVQDYHAQDAGPGGGDVELARSLQTLALNLRNLLGPGEGVHVVAAMVQGGPYAEQAERRRRDRYSILTGFAAEDYLPLDSDHIGYIETRWSPTNQLLRARSGSSPLLIPYEWLEFQPDNNSTFQQIKHAGPDHLLLLWLDESRFYDTPFQLVDAVLSHVVGYLTPSQRRRVEFSLLGPATSEGFRAMLQEAAGARTTRPSPVLLSAKSMANLEANLDDYLDDGLFAQVSGESLARLEADLDKAWGLWKGQTLVELQQATVKAMSSALPEVVDSDQRWAETVTTEWLVELASSQPGGDAAADSRAAEVLLLVTDWYLDDGLPADTQQGMSQRISDLTSLYARTYGQGESGVIRVLGTALAVAFPDISDTDEDWALSAAGLWWDTYGVFEASGLPDAPGARQPRGALQTREEALMRALARAVLADERDSQAASLEPLEFFLLEAFPRIGVWDRDPARPDFRERLSEAIARREYLPFETASSVVDRWFYDQFELIHGVENEGSKTGTSVLPMLDVYSSRATAIEDYLIREKGAGSPQESLLASVRSFNRTIGDDGRLVAEIARELFERRNLAGDAVILVGEWDTFYSRTLAEKFREVFSCSGRAGAVIPVNYLRGLDGALPGQSRSAEESPSRPLEISASSAAATARDAGTRQERASGPMQIDYFRRLASGMADFVPKGMEVGAIGIIGSDIYDKLLILQALRAQFPGVLFFTTDLDARLLHPAVYPDARNLLVATQYGLTLAPKYQGPFPPFRDGYQTSTYLAARWALQMGPAGGKDGLWLPAIEEARPLLFEIGRYQARNISARSPLAAEATGESEECALTAALPSDVSIRSKWNDVHPGTDRREITSWDFVWTVARVGQMTLLMVLAITLVAPSVSPLRKFVLNRADIERSDRLAVYSVMALIVTLVAAISMGVWLGQEEPFSLLGGVSTWPTEFLRAAATVLSLAFILAGLSAVRRNTRALHADCCLQPAGAASEGDQRPNSAATEGVPTRVGALKRWRATVSISDWRNPERTPFGEGEEEQAETIWSEYVHRGTARNRASRFVPMALAYLVVGTLAVSLVGTPDAPVRGDFARWLDRGLFGLSFVALTLLVFFVVDATRLCRRMIAIMSNRRTIWPAGLCKKLGLQRNIDAEDVADYIDIRFIGERTEVIAPLVVYPFVVLFVLLLSRNSYFDNWTWPPALVVAFAVLSMFAILSALGLRWAAEDARKRAVDRLRRRISRGLADKRPDKRDYVRRLELLVDEIRSIEQGAFAPWSRHPVMQALLIPFGGIGAVALIDILATLGL